MKQEELRLVTDLSALVRDLAKFVADAVLSEQQGQDYPHLPGDEACLGERLTALGQRLQARLTDATAKGARETIELVKALRAVNRHTEPVAAGLFAGSLSVEKQHEFAGLLTSLGELLHIHADEQAPPSDIARRFQLGPAKTTEEPAS